MEKIDFTTSNSPTDEISQPTWTAIESLSGLLYTISGHLPRFGYHRLVSSHDCVDRTVRTTQKHGLGQFESIDETNDRPITMSPGGQPFKDKMHAMSFIDKAALAS